MSISHGMKLLKSLRPFHSAHRLYERSIRPTDSPFGRRHQPVLLGLSVKWEASWQRRRSIIGRRKRTRVIVMRSKKSLEMRFGISPRCAAGSIPDERDTCRGGRWGGLRVFRCRERLGRQPDLPRGDPLAAPNLTRRFSNSAKRRPVSSAVRGSQADPRSRTDQICRPVSAGPQRGTRHIRGSSPNESRSKPSASQPPDYPNLPDFDK